MKQFKYLLLIIFLGILSFSFAQKNIDQELKEYETASLNRKMELFFYFFQKFELEEKDSVLYYVNDLLREGIENKNQAAIALANYGSGPYLLSNSLFDEASDKLEKAKNYYHKVENDTMLAIV